MMAWAWVPARLDARCFSYDAIRAARVCARPKDPCSLRTRLSPSPPSHKEGSETLMMFGFMTYMVVTVTPRLRLALLQKSECPPPCKADGIEPGLYLREGSSQMSCCPDWP